jgi:hypothetical protein
MKQKIRSIAVAALVMQTAVSRKLSRPARRDPAAVQVAKRHRKLASHKVAGNRPPKKSWKDDGIVRHFPSSRRDERFFQRCSSHIVAG